jgi:hypothetical protein
VGRGSWVLSPPCRKWPGGSWEQAASSSFPVEDLLQVVTFVSFLHRYGGSLNESAAWFAATACLGGCGPSLARRCRHPQWWGRHHGPAMAFSSSWLHAMDSRRSWPPQRRARRHGVYLVGKGFSVRCAKAVSRTWSRSVGGVPPPLCGRVVLLLWMVLPRGRHRGRCIVVVPLDAYSLVLVFVLPHVVLCYCYTISTPFLIQ